MSTMPTLPAIVRPMLTAAMLLLLTTPAPVIAWLEAEDIDVKVRGQVVDETGAPVADAYVHATPQTTGHVLGWAQAATLIARSDTEGRFELQLPFREVRYALYAQRMGYSVPSVTILPDVGGVLNPLRITLKREKHTTIHGRVLGPAGPVSNLNLTLVGEYHYQATTRTLVDGSYRFEVPQYIGQGVLVAERGELAVAQEIVRGTEDAQGRRVDVQLVPASQLQGVVRDRNDQAPVANAVVTIRPWFSSGFKMHARCDAQGRYLIDAVPPGKYLVEATAPLHFDKPPRGVSYEREQVEVEAGQTETHDIQMGRSAVVRGRVTDRDGRPVANAAVGMPTGWAGDYREQNRYVRTNDRGQFEIVTGHVGAHIGQERLNLAAFSVRGGLSHLTLEPLKEGEVRNEVNLKLPGAIRLRGVIVDGQGKPVRDVVCAGGLHGVSEVSGADGTFDLGWLSLPFAGEAKMQLMAHSPRPSMASGLLIWPVRGPVNATAKEYFEDQTVGLDATPAKELDVKVTLKPTDLLTLEGQVTDANGEPVKDVRLHLFAGNADDGTWTQQVLPNISSGYIVVNNRLLADITTDAKGRFTLHTLRFDGEAAADGTRYSIGITRDNTAVKLMKDVILPADGKRRELKITLE